MLDPRAANVAPFTSSNIKKKKTVLYYSKAGCIQFIVQVTLNDFVVKTKYTMFCIALRQMSVSIAGMTAIQHQIPHMQKTNQLFKVVVLTWAGFKRHRKDERLQ